MCAMRGRGGLRGGRGGAPGANNAQLRSAVLSQKTNAVRRLQKDLKELRDAEVPLVGVSATPLDDSIFTWHCNIRAPSDSAYAGGVFHVEMTFPQDYPCSPPGLTIYVSSLNHPNVFGTKLCLDMLEPAAKGASRWYEGWNSAYTVESILIQLQSFLFDKPKRTKGKKKDEMIDEFKATVDEANSFKCSKCKHRGPIEPYPPFNQKEADLQAFCFLRDPKQMAEDELLCFHSRTPLAESTLGVGVSLSRLPRTGEIRSVTPSMDLLCLRAFQKQNVRKSIDGVKFTHWLPLYFGESKPYDKKSQYFDEKTKKFENKVTHINPRERMIHLLQKSLCFLTKKDTRKDMTPEMVIEVMPKLLTTHLVDMVSENTHVSLVAIRRLWNFIRLFRLLIELKPESETIINERLQSFKDHPEKRVKDFCSSLGDILSFATISSKFTLEDVLDAYLEEQLDRQAFWIIRQIPELDHTDDKFKGKEVILEESRNEVCFKTGLTGFHITMIFYTICDLIKNKWSNNFKNIDESLDDRFGCMSDQIENTLQAQFKAIKRIDNFNKYYQWLKRNCPDAGALALRLRQAVTNSKEKRYHGCSEHMNVLPTMDVQATTHLLAEPSPFSFHNKEKNSYDKPANDDAWKQAVLKKFEWTMILLKDESSNHTPASLAMKSDNMHLNEKIVLHENDALLRKHAHLRTSSKWNYTEITSQVCVPDYTGDFSWRQLFHKLCFEDMLQNLPVTCDFKLMYEYIDRMGSDIPVLRLETIDKTKLKSNQYWLMALVSKMPNLRVLKLHKCDQGKPLGKDGYKFLLKGLTYMKENGRQLSKIHFSSLLGEESAEYLYPCLKLNEDLQVLSFSDLNLSVYDSKAIGKVLADFKQIKELNLTNCRLNTTTVKDIADGLMRAKQLEMIKMAKNPLMGKSVNTVIYNLAFSPRIKFIDLEGMKGTDVETAEALYKLLNISGSIETLNLRHASVINQLTPDFYKAVGQNKTLKYLNVSLDTDSCSQTQIAYLGKAVAMNAKQKGHLKGLVMNNWFVNYNSMIHFLYGTKICEQDQEMWYGDKNLAQKMSKEELVKKMHFGLEFLSVGGTRANLANTPFRPKTIAMQPKPEWPDFIHAMTQGDLIFCAHTSKYNPKDMDMIAHTIGENPINPCKITRLNLSKSPIMKEGAKLLAPGIAANKSIMHLDLSHTKIGVSGMVRIAEALQKNSTLKSLNLYRNILDVDGARSIGALLKVNSTIEFMDIGHNRIRQTGLKAICDGVLANPNSKLSELGIRANFINDDGINYLFEKLVIGKQQLKQIYLKTNFLSEYFKISLSNQVKEKNIKVFVDDFRAVDYLVKEKLERSIWISPVTDASSVQSIKNVLSSQNECGFVTDIRISQGRKAPGRPLDNMYAVVEFLDQNSVARSLKLASVQKAYFGGIKVRIFKSGTQTAILQPQQKRR